MESLLSFTSSRSESDPTSTANNHQKKSIDQQINISKANHHFFKTESTFQKQIFPRTLIFFQRAQRRSPQIYKIRFVRLMISLIGYVLPIYCPSRSNLSFTTNPRTTSNTTKYLFFQCGIEEPVYHQDCIYLYITIFCR